MSNGKSCNKLNDAKVEFKKTTIRRKTCYIVLEQI